MVFLVRMFIFSFFDELFWVIFFFFGCIEELDFLLYYSILVFVFFV